MDTDVASKISTLMHRISGDLTASVFLIEETCSQSEFEAYRLATGKVMGEILFEVLNPVYRSFPQLKPPGLD